jgi:hypothetical protein
MKEILEKAGFTERDIRMKLLTFAEPAVNEDSIGTC